MDGWDNPAMQGRCKDSSKKIGGELQLEFLDAKTEKHKLADLGLLGKQCHTPWHVFMTVVSPKGHYLLVMIFSSASQGLGHLNRRQNCCLVA
jgi:hypothetical protein